MFYLLENNRIIKDNKKFTHIYCYINKKGFLYKVFTDKEYGKNKKIGYIKKQSENVFDLIEEGDLVKTYGIHRVFSINTELKHLFGIVDRKTCIAIRMDGISAIYKQDENGNYIKVWEKKEDEKED